MHLKKTKYIVVTGGVLSGLGKGIVTASIGNILKSQGLCVSAVKIDPYINIDAGTMRPTEHGEVFVTEDGGEADQDLGNYERFIGISARKLNNITTGQVYLSVIQRERNLEYAGKCVEVIPHIPHEIERRIKEVAKSDSADIVMVEIGGTVGDYQSVLFLEAVRNMKQHDDVIFVHVVYLPIPSNLGEMKTKPAQHSVRELMASGIQPDFIVGRSSKPMDEIRKEKLALFCNVRPEHIISSPDTESIYDIPLLFDRQGFAAKVLAKMKIPYKPKKLDQWRSLLKRIKNPKGTVKIGIVGKYFDTGDFSLEDSYISVIEAVKHACYYHGMKPDIKWINSKDLCDKRKLKNLENYDGIIVPGGFGHSGVEGKIDAIRYVRENNIPFLGLCYGMQLAVVEYARNMCGLKDAHSVEIDPDTKNPVIMILPEQEELLKEKNYGNTMRLGAYPAKIKSGSKVHSLYNASTVIERHRHRYEVNPNYIETFEQHGLVFSGVSPNRRLMEFIELPKHPFFVATQAHPEFKSRPLRPSPPFIGLVAAAIKRKKSIKER